MLTISGHSSKLFRSHWIASFSGGLDRVLEDSDSRDRLTEALDDGDIVGYLEVRGRIDDPDAAGESGSTIEVRELNVPGVTKP